MELHNPVAVFDDEIAYSSMIVRQGEVGMRWPDMAYFTPYGYVMPVNEHSVMILDYLENGFDELIPPDNGVASAMIIDWKGHVFRVAISGNGDGPTEYYPDFSRRRVMTGPGARYVLAANAQEHDKFQAAMLASNSLTEAVGLFEQLSQCFHHDYTVVNINEIAKHLEEMGYTLPFPLPPTGKRLPKSMEESCQSKSERWR